MINKVILVGNLGQDPEIKETESGKPYARLSVATSQSWTSKETGERKERTEWHRVVVWSKSWVNYCQDRFKKGSKLYVEGKLATRSWEKDGRKFYSTEIVVQAGKGSVRALERREEHYAGPSGPDDYGRGDSYESNAYMQNADTGVF